MFDEPVAPQLVQERIERSFLNWKAHLPERHHDLSGVTALELDGGQHEGFEHAAPQGCKLAIFIHVATVTQQGTRVYPSALSIRSDADEA